MGSVCMYLLSLRRLRRRLPARLHDAGNFSAQRHTAKTDAAHLKLADIAARAAATAAAVANADLEFRLLAVRAMGLSRSSFAQRNPEALQQLAALLIVFRRRGQRDVHSFDLVHAGVINLREDQLVLEPQRVIPAAVKSVRGQAAEVGRAS